MFKMFLLIFFLNRYYYERLSVIMLYIYQIFGFFPMRLPLLKCIHNCFIDCMNRYKYFMWSNNVKYVNK